MGRVNPFLRTQYPFNGTKGAIGGFIRSTCNGSMRNGVHKRYYYVYHLVITRISDI